MARGGAMGGNMRATDALLEEQPEDAVFLVKPQQEFARAGLPVYRAGQDQDERARWLQPLVSGHTTSRARS